MGGVPRETRRNIQSNDGDRFAPPIHQSGTDMTDKKKSPEQLVGSPGTELEFAL